MSLLDPNAELKALRSLHIFTEPEADPVAGYVLINGTEIEGILPLDSPEVSMLKEKNYNVIDYGTSFIFPGLVDINVHLNSIAENEWEDIENIGKMALQGGITTIVDNPIMGSYSETLDEGKAISRRIKSLEGKIYTDTALLAYLGPHNLEKLEELWENHNIIGFRLYLARSLMNQLPHFETKDYNTLQKKIQGLFGADYRFFVHCESATARDMFTCSPLRFSCKEDRLDLKVNIKDSSKFGGGIQGEMAGLDDDSNKESSSDSDSDEYKDNVEDLASKGKRNSLGGEEIQSGVLRKKADKNAKLQEEQSIARLEIVGYSFNEEEKELIQKMHSSDSEMEYIIQSSESSGDENSKAISPFEQIERQEIKVENIKKNIIAIKNKVNMGKRNSFLNNPLKDSLRDALGRHLQGLEALENEAPKNESPKHRASESTLLVTKESEAVQNTEKCENATSRNRSPSNLLARRKQTGSPTQTHQQSPQVASPEKTIASEFQIRCKKSVEELDADKNELKMNRDYQLFLSNHSLSWETNGVMSMLTVLAELFRTEKSKGKLILTNLSSSNAAFLVRNKAKASQYNLDLYCETSIPFIYFHRNHIKPGQGKFKCSPCIRDKETRNLLIDGLMLNNLFHAVSSFHLQTDKKFKKIEKGNFKRVFNGVSTIGLNLQVVWTKLYTREKRKFEKNEKYLDNLMKRLVFLLASSPAEIAGLARKGKIKKGFDADIVIWNPFKLIEVGNKNVHLKYKGLFLFRNQKFYGEVSETYLRGVSVFSKEGFKRTGTILSH